MNLNPIGIFTDIIAGQTKLAEQMRTVTELTSNAIEMNRQNLKLIALLRDRIEQLEQKVNQ